MNSHKEYERKIRKQEQELRKSAEKIALLTTKVKRLTEENKYLKKRLRELEQSRDNWKAKNKDKGFTIKSLNAKINRRDKSKRHHYASWLVDLCVRLRLQGGCSYQSICRILVTLQLCFNLKMNKLPCANSVQNWVSKVGYYTMENCPKTQAGEPVTLIIDESIRIGKEKLLLVLSVGWEKQKKEALNFQDVEVVYMESSQSWNAKKIQKVIEKIEASLGFQVKNVLSDEDGKLKKACILVKYPHLPDISHAIATCLRKTFDKQLDFKSFTGLIASYQCKGVNQDLSYLLPPKQRAKARFMNLSGIVRWAQNMLERFDNLNQTEREFFSQLPEHEKMSTTLTTCLDIAKQVCLPFKELGLSKDTLEDSRKIIDSVDKPEGYVQDFLTHLNDYMIQYQKFIDKHAKDTTLHVSSEIIESMFGKYKEKASNYALTGLTNLNLELAAYCMDEKELLVQVPLALDDTYMSDLQEWKVNHSPENQIVRRNKFFEKRP